MFARELGYAFNDFPESQRVRGVSISWNLAEAFYGKNQVPINRTVWEDELRSEFSQKNVAGRRVQSGGREYDIIKATTWMKEIASFPFRIVLVKSYYTDGHFHECATFMEDQREGHSEGYDFYWGYYFPNPEDNEEYSLAQAERDFNKRVIEARVYHPDVKVVEGDKVGRSVETAERLLKITDNIPFKNNRQRSVDIYLMGKLIDTAFFDADMSLTDIRKDLIDHDGYDPRIVVAWGRQ